MKVKLRRNETYEASEYIDLDIQQHEHLPQYIIRGGILYKFDINLSHCGERYNEVLNVRNLDLLENERLNEALIEAHRSSCVAHRCMEHRSIAVQNRNEFTGAECGGCIAAERDKEIVILKERVETLEYERDAWKAGFKP